ncbi:MAG: DNA/RNA non-specific endonuclease [Rikenellaceae bacterium]|nr:DNA/RNA non-specific endonuclease [Rikenellaceae bacterium]
MFRLATFTVVAAFCWSQCLVNQWGWKEGPETVGPIRERSTGQPDSESSRERPVNPESMASPALPSASGNRAAAPVVNSVESESDLKRHSTESSAYGLEIPAVDQPEFLVVCPEGRYTLWYDTLYRQAAWTAHVLTRADMETSRAERKNGFVICQTVRSKGWPYAKSSDYTRSGYDRGHLVPSADRTGSRTENDATFRLSNIDPKNPRLNRVVWNQLKDEIRQMALRLDTLWVVTGGELKPGLERIGASGVGVPEHFFKVLLARKKGEWMAMAFLVPNRSELKPSFWEYALSVAEAERLLGIDFFHTLPKALQRRIESECHPQRWQ